MRILGLVHLDWLTVLGLLLAINGLTVIAFWDDKRRAVVGHRRIPEGNLLFLALLGGTPGAYAARHTFRHKTRKQPFSAMLHATALAQAAALAWWAIQSA